MGLDIYIRKGKKNRAAGVSISKAYDNFEKDASEKYFNALRRFNPKRFKTEQSALKKFIKLIKKYDAHLYKYEYYDEKERCWKLNFTTLEDVKNYIEETLAKKDDFYTRDDLYYRKVNFLYAFFPTVEHEMAWIVKSDAQRLVDKCDEVLALDKDNLQDAEDILPTISGFFFGSTDYDKYYKSDVKEVRRDFSKLLKKWADDEIAIIYFSW